MLPTLLIGFNAKPILTLAERLRHLDPNRSFEGVAERYRNRAGSDLPRIQSVGAAIRLARSGTREDSAFARLQSMDPENALFAYLRAAQAAGNASANDASARFEIVAPLIETALQAERCDWYVSEAMEAWQWAYQTIDVGPTMTVRWARDAATREQATAIGDVSASLLRLADDLLRAGQDQAGHTCVRGALDFSRRTLDDARGADVALACAGSIERARRLECAILARAGKWEERQRADDQAESAAQFAQILRGRMESATFTGTAFLVEPIFRKVDVVLSGEKPRTYDHQSDESNKRVTLNFCGISGTTVFLDLERHPDIFGFCGGTFDDPNWFDRSQGNCRHIFTRSAQDGVVLPANLDIYEAHALQIDGTPNQPVIFAHAVLVKHGS